VRRDVNRSKNHEKKTTAILSFRSNITRQCRCSRCRTRQLRIAVRLSGCAREKAWQQIYIRSKNLARRYSCNTCNSVAFLPRFLVRPTSKAASVIVLTIDRVASDVFCGRQSRRRHALQSLYKAKKKKSHPRCVFIGVILTTTFRHFGPRPFFAGIASRAFGQ